VSDTALANAAMTVEAAMRDAAWQPEVRAFFDPATFTASYVVRDPQSNICAIVDSVLDFDPSSGRTGTTSADAIIAFVERHRFRVEWLLETHVHADHLSAAAYIQGKLGGKIAIGKEIRTVQETFGNLFNLGGSFPRDGSQFDRLFGDGDIFAIGGLEVTVLHVPGHTPADLAYVVGNAAFVGDTLFMPDYGTARADFPGGDARALYRSIQRILSLPAETRIFLCHDYKAPGREDFRWETSVGDEKARNVHVHEGVDEGSFVAMRQARDATLDMPRLILPSIQVNMRAGRLPEPESNGIRYLRLPLDVL
jgi:glyoxylase-like metal-dependent hydrolase (beta-lactamase superfamily II)